MWVVVLVTEAQAADYTVNLKGGPLKGIPELKYTLRLTYEMDSRWGPVWLLISHSYTGDFSVSGIQRELDELNQEKQPTSALLGGVKMVSLVLELT